MPQRDDLRHGAHAHGLRAEELQHANLGGRLVRWAEESGIHAFAKDGVRVAGDGSKCLAQGRVVGDGHVGKARTQRLFVGTGEGRYAHEVQVVGHEHQVAGRPRGLEATRGVGEQDRTHAEAAHDAHALHDAVDGVSLVEMHAALHADDGHACARAEAHVARVTDDGGRGHVREVGVGDLHESLQRVGECPEATSQHDADVRLQGRSLAQGEDAIVDAGGHTRPGRLRMGRHGGGD